MVSMAAPKILVIEDDHQITQMVTRYLEAEQFQVITADNGRDGLTMALNEDPDLVVLDLMLPELDGISLCRQLRAASPDDSFTPPVIMLTAKSDEIDRLLGLEIGADDYITKPFSLRELVARIRVILRRTARQPLADSSPAENSGPAQASQDVLRYRDLALYPREFRAEMAGRDLSCTPTEFKLLHTLVSNPGRVYSRLQLLDAALGELYAGYERSIDTHISNLRRKLGDDPNKSPEYIKTIYGVGYKVDTLPRARDADREDGD